MWFLRIITEPDSGTLPVRGVAIQDPGTAHSYQSKRITNRMLPANDNSMCCSRFFDRSGFSAKNASSRAQWVDHSTADGRQPFAPLHFTSFADSRIQTSKIQNQTQKTAGPSGRESGIRINCRSLLRHVMPHGVGCKPVIYMLIGMTGDAPGDSGGHFAPVKSALMWCAESHKLAVTNPKLCLHPLWAWAASHGLTATISNTGYGDEGTSMDTKATGLRQSGEPSPPNLDSGALVCRGFVAASLSASLKSREMRRRCLGRRLLKQTLPVGEFSNSLAKVSGANRRITTE